MLRIILHLTRGLEYIFEWENSYYLLIRVDDVFGGFDVSFDVVEGSYLEEVYESADTNGVLDSIKGMVKQPYFWSFRRTAGQFGIVNIVGSSQICVTPQGLMSKPPQ
ncbi:MAG: hypothetical protein P8101_16930 [Candidatus Thiodiazotropha sp.]|jgi:hypothetical protein